MSSILRSSVFVRHIFSSARNFVFSPQREFEGHVFLKSHLLNLPKSLATAAAATSQSSVETLDRSLRRIDLEVRRAGRISHKDIEDVLDEIRHSSFATSSQSLMVIRCCGSLVPEETPQARTKLVNEIWKTLEKIGVAMDISHYNALLRVYLENEHPFSPSEFLAELEAKGVEPNRVTYQRLMAGYCQRGDIDGATRILEFMREKQLPVNEGVFNALILGHSQANDIESASGILGVMRQAGLEPSNETYTILLCGYARTGDIDKMRVVLAESVEKDVLLMDRDYLEVVYTLAVSGHSHLVDEVLGQVRHQVGFNQEAVNVILRLVSGGQEEIALKVLRTMVKPTRMEGISYAFTGHFMIRHLIKCNRPLEKILCVCEALNSEGLNPRALYIAVEAALIAGNRHLSLPLLAVYNQQGYPLRPHYYWPLLAAAGKSRDVAGMHEVLRAMVEAGLPVMNETLRDYCVPYLTGGDEAAINELRLAGISIGAAAAAVVSAALIKGNLAAAANIALQYRARYPFNIRRYLVSAYQQSGNSRALVSLLHSMTAVEPELEVPNGGSEEAADDRVVEPRELVGQVLLELVGEFRKNQAQFKDILQHLLDHGMGITNSTAELIQARLAERLTPEISALLSKLTSGDLIPTTLTRPNKQFVLKDEQALLNSIATLEGRGDSAKSLKLQLLSFYCQKKDLENALKVKQELDAEGFVYQSGRLVQLMDLMAYHDRVEEALDCYSQLMEKYPGIVINSIKIIRLVAALIKANRFQEGIEILERNSRTKEEAASAVTGGEETHFLFQSLCWRMLNSLAEAGDATSVRLLFDTLVNHNFIQPNNVYLGPLVKVHLLKNDIDQAMETFEWCCHQHRATPWKSELTVQLIQKEDAAMLQKVTDLSTEIHGEVNSLYDLVFAFIDCGRVRQARRILETPGMQPRPQRVNKACSRYTSEGNVSSLERLVEATKDLMHIDRSDIYFHLLLSYCSKTDDVDKALGLWTQMQEEDVQPSDKFLLTLGKYLQKNGQPVPFSMPKETLESGVRGESGSVKERGGEQYRSLALRNMRKALESKDLDTAMHLLEELKTPALELSIQDRSDLLNQCMQFGRLKDGTALLLDWLRNGSRPSIRVCNQYIQVLAKMGEADTLMECGQYLSTDTKRLVTFDNRLVECMVGSGRAAEYLDSMEAKMAAAVTPEDWTDLAASFPRTGSLQLLEDHPELLPKYESMATRFVAQGHCQPSTMLWVYHMLGGREERASEVMATQLLGAGGERRVALQPVLAVARRRQKPALVHALLEAYRAAGVQLQPNAMAAVCTALVSIHCNLGQYDEALKQLEEGLKTCELEDIGKVCLTTLRQGLESDGKLFNYTIPPSRKSHQRNSSSSSDSDDEAAKKIE